MNHHGGQNGPNGWDPDQVRADLAKYSAEAHDLAKIAPQEDRDELPLKELQQIALDEMEKIDKKCDAANVVRVGPYYWITDPKTGNLHLACDTAPIPVVKVLGLENVQRLYEEAKRQEHE